MWLSAFSQLSEVRRFIVVDSTDGQGEQYAEENFDYRRRH